MRRTVTVLSLAAALAGTQSADAEHRYWWADVIWTQRVDIPDDPDKLARCDYVSRGAASRTHLGYVIELPPEIADGTRSFRTLDGFMGALDGAIAEPANVDVSFFSDLGSCSTDVPPGLLARFFGDGPDAGTIPAGARYALVTLASKPTSAFIFEVVDHL